jgi:hypothetical protein
MIFMEDLVRFGLGHSTSLLKSFVISEWGTSIEFECLYDPHDRLPYRIQLLECSNVGMLVHSPENASENILSITDITIKDTSANLKEFTMYSEVFELTVICELVNFHKNEALLYDR